MKISLKEFIVYIIGMLILGLGLSLSTKMALGTSALVALPFSISEIYNLNFGNVTLVYYVILIIIEIIVHIIMKKFSNIIENVLQIVVSLIFTRYLNFLVSSITIFDKFNNIPYYVWIVLYIIPIVLIGIGAALTIKTDLPPNPADGFVETMMHATKKDLGLVKNFIDITFVIITCVFSYITCHKIIGVGIGTILAMLFVGRVIHLFNRLIGDKIKLK